MPTENGVSNVSWYIFLQPSNLFSNFFFKTESKAAYFSLITGLSLASVTKCTQLFAITWAGNTLCPPCALFAGQIALIAHWCFAVAEWWVCSQGQVGMLGGEQRQQPGHSSSCVGPHADRGLWVGHACPNWKVYQFPVSHWSCFLWITLNSSSFQCIELSLRMWKNQALSLSSEAGECVKK